MCSTNKGFNMTNLLQIIQPLEIQSRKYLNQIAQATISTEADRERACVFLKEISDFKKSAEAQKKEQTAELKAQIKEIDAQFKPALDFLTQADSITREKINQYLNAERIRQEKLAIERKRQEEEEALRRCEEIENLKKDADKYDPATREALLQSLQEQQNREIGKTATNTKINLSSNASTVRTVWTFEIEDISKIPAEFLEVNSKAVNDAIRSGVREISGIKIFQKSVVAVK